nr:FtsK/SpoIIIE domain-containing protein [Shouchella patagoniensis]
MDFVFVSPLLVGAACGVVLNVRRKWSDRGKLEKIFEVSGLLTKEKQGENTVVKKCRLHRKTAINGGTEYVYRIPLGMTFEDFEKALPRLQDGVNNKKNGLQKEVAVEYDGMLRIRVYDAPMPEIIPYANITKGWSLPVGISRTQLVQHDFEKIPHLIVAGTTRYGKTVFLKMAVTTLIMNEPKRTELALIDLKGGLAFNRFKDVKQVRSVSCSPQEALTHLKAIKADIEARISYFDLKKYEDVQEAEKKGERFSRVFIVVDEAAELSSQGIKDKDDKADRQECEKIMAYIARVAGGVGYRIIYCTQYPTADTLPRQVKQNADAKLCFRLQTVKASEVVLDEGGAESLPYIKGRAIYQTDRKHIVQVPFMSNEYIEEHLSEHKEERQHENNEGVQRKEGDSNIIEFG